MKLKILIFKHCKVLIWLITKVIINYDLKNAKNIGNNKYQNFVPKIIKNLVIWYLPVSYYNIIKRRPRISGHFHLNCDKKHWNQFLQKNLREILYAIQFNHHDFRLSIMIRF